MKTEMKTTTVVMETRNITSFVCAYSIISVATHPLYAAILVHGSIASDHENIWEDRLFQTFLMPPYAYYCVSGMLLIKKKTVTCIR